MWNYKWKTGGYIISLIGLIAIIIEHQSIPVFHKILNNDIFIALSRYSVIFGFYCIAFSKEKLENERIKSIRLKSIIFSFFVIQAIVLTVALCKNISHDFNIDATALYEIATIGIASYIIQFNYKKIYSVGKRY